ncbi:MAG: SpoIID/LytB domain-containing protein [Patescibacteria group bacterium]|mgnify:CR=1 FL=1
MLHKILIITTALILGFLSVPTVSYAEKQSNDDEAVVLIQSQRSLTLTTLQQHRFGIGIKNTGTRGWKKGEGIVLRSKARNKSYFFHSSWKGRNVVMDLPENVAPGELVYFWFNLEAPKTPGSYVEELILYKGSTPFSKTATRVPITVVAGNGTQTQSVSRATPIVAAPVSPTTPNVSLTAFTLIKSANALTMKQYERAQYGIGYKNTSDRPWRVSDGITLRSKVARESYFYDASWKSGNIVMNLPQDVQPGELVYFWFTLFAPIYPRDFQENLALYQGERKIDGSDVSIPITVVPASSSVLTSAQENAGSVSMIETELSQDTAGVERPAPVVPLAHLPRPGIVDEKTETEPFIRVGLYHTTEPIRMTADKAYDVRDQNGRLIATVPAGGITTVTFDFSTNIYTVATPSVITTTNTYIRMRGTEVPYRITTKPDGTFAVEPVADQNTIFEALSFVNNPSWSTAINDNRFRGEMEVRYAPATGRLWVVNELLFEQYLKGIAETSNSSPYEYQKALMVAARTYAKSHIDRNSKHAADGFTVRPTEADQVYRGYNSEQRMPNNVRSAQETEGVMVHYDGNLAITPYSANTDGRTRAAHEVWGGAPRPWLISVPDPCCTGMATRYSETSYSHQVGMSQRGAIAMALDNKSFEEILKYYYTNIELIRRY